MFSISASRVLTLGRYFRKAEGFDPNRQYTNVDISSKGQDGPWKIGQTGYAAVSTIHDLHSM